MVEQDHSELTQAEAELYDRQIRLWGLENQKRFVHFMILWFKIVLHVKHFTDCEAQKSWSLESMDWVPKSEKTSSWLVWSRWCSWIIAMFLNWISHRTFSFPAIIWEKIGLKRRALELKLWIQWLMFNSTLEFLEKKLKNSSSSLTLSWS